jgi:hypothetical protein
MEIWIPLISAVIGGLIAVIPVMISLITQSIERDKDRQEKRRESKAQLKGRIIERDSEIVMNACDQSVMAIREMRAIYDRALELEEEVKKGKITPEARDEKHAVLIAKLEDNFSKMREIHSVGFGRLYSLGDEIVKAYYDFESIVTQLQNAYRGLNPVNVAPLWVQVFERRGALQRLLNQKVVSSYSEE